jgi:hypothetical protein
LTTDRFGNCDKAFSFDGQDDFIDIPNNAVLSSPSSALSLSVWFKIDSWNINFPPFGYASLISKSDINYCQYRLSVSNMDVSLVFNGINWRWTYNQNNILPGVWNNLVVTFDVSGTSFYLNGVYFGSDNQNSEPFGTLQNLEFGRDQIGGIDYYNGKIDDIGIWNRALTDQEITDLYNANICYEYVTVTDTLVINTGITGYNPITYLNTLKIWPNPTNDHITIDAGNLATMNGYSIKIEDAQGQQVFQNAVNQQQFYVDITTWGGNGLYFVRIIDPQGNTVDIKKIVLQ